MNRKLVGAKSPLPKASRRSTSDARNSSKHGDEPASEKPDGAFPIVGIGASAGGLEAIESLFRNMPTDTGMAFVLVQHLDPDHKSILTELVARFTHMPVQEAVQGLRVEANHVYVIPPRRDLALLNGVLHLMEPAGERHLRLSIDYFFRSLAQDQGSNSFCIVLSGAGSDGSLGLRAIKGEGGVALIQDPQTAAYDSMPRSADATGLADAVLPPAQMGPWLQSLARGILVPGAAEQVRRELESQSEIDKLFVLVRNRTGYDFSQYKESTIRRRIERRMVINRTNKLADYVRLLQQNSAELDRLWKEFLIRVTQFFRNPKAITALEEKAIPALFNSSSSEKPLRVWVPGCSTGEEAYSIAMLLQDHMERERRARPVQIFATDIDEEALQIARIGVYPTSIVADVPAKYLRRHFLKHPQGFQIAKPLRSMLVFSRHDVARDSPFSHLDLVSCRNLLIYMSTPLQARVIESLTYALRPDGALFLGHSESLGKLAGLYEPVDTASKLYRRRDTTIARFAPPARMPRRHPLSADALPGKAADGNKLKDLTEAALLDDCTRACVVVDERQQVIYVHGRTGQFLEPATGRASLNVLKMARDGLRLELGKALRDVAGGRPSERFERLLVKTLEGERRVNFTIRPLPGTTGRPGLLMIIFEDAGPAQKRDALPGEADASTEPTDARIGWLEQELASTRETLQAANEQLESSNEELQSTVEELQSSNEELTTSQEELSSINEELQTVNAELEDKLQQLESTTNDLENLLASSDVGTVFLDLDLRVRRFTPAAARIVNLIDGDIGRPMRHIAHTLEYDRLLADAEAVLDSLQSKAVEVRSRDGRWYSVRIALYRAGSNAIDGVVLTFFDLTERMLSERRFYDLLQVTPDATVLTNTRGEIVQANQQAERLFGYTREELIGRPVESLVPDRLRTWHDDERRRYQVAPRSRTMGRRDLQLVAQRKDGTEFPADIAIGPVQTAEGLLFAAAVRDVSEKRRAHAILDRISNLSRIFYDWNRARILRGERLAQSLQVLSGLLVEKGSCRQCWIGLDVGAGTKRYVLAAHSGFQSGGAESLSPSWLALGRAGEPRILRDLPNGAGPKKLREQATSWGCRALLSAPMHYGEQRLGMLVVTSVDTHAFSEEEVLLWKTFSASLGVMLAAAPLASLKET